MHSVEFLYFPLNQAPLPHLDGSKWDPLDDKVWITAATRVGVPPDGKYTKYDNNQLAVQNGNLPLNIATYLYWVVFEIGAQTENLDLQASWRSPS